MEKRTQAERLAIAEELVTSVRWEIDNGKVDTSVLQTAVYIQVEIDRIVWKLNRINNGYDD